MFEFIDQLITAAMGAITSGSPWAILTLFFVVALTECGIPFPFILDSVLFVSAYQANVNPWHIVIVILIVFLGRHFGSSLIYWATRLLGNVVIYWFGKRFKHLRQNWESLTEKLSSRAPMAIAITRVTGLMTLASVFSGAMRIHYASFAIGVSLSSLIFDGSLIILGLITKYVLQVFGITPPSTWQIIIGLIVIMSIVMGIMAWRERGKFKKNGKKKDEEKKEINKAGVE
jgi:membrane protein DedA with SNARE-associated domain